MQHLCLKKWGAMAQTKKQELHIQKFGENLSTFAVNRDDLKELLHALPTYPEINLTTVEYELQILKIIIVGWSISFYMKESDPNKKHLSKVYWTCIREVSNNISELTGVTTGQQINYFEILNNRLDKYVSVLQKSPNQTLGASSDTSAIIGATFAEICDLDNNAAIVLVGIKMFTFTLGAIKEYLDAVEIKQNKEKYNEN